MYVNSSQTKRGKKLCYLWKPQDLQGISIVERKSTAPLYMAKHKIANQYGDGKVMSPRRENCITELQGRNLLNMVKDRQHEKGILNSV